MNDKTKAMKPSFTCTSVIINPCYVTGVQKSGRKYKVIDNVTLRLETEYDIKDSDLNKIASQIMEALNKDEKLKEVVREEGFYWIKWHDEPGGALGKWDVLYFDGDKRWYATTGAFEYSDPDFAEIDERRIIRDEHPGYVETSLGNWVKEEDLTTEDALKGIQRLLDEYHQQHS